MSQLLDKNAAAALIQTGKPLLFAGDEKLLATLPRGNWVGGTIPYFMTEQGGITTADRVFVTEIPYATGAVVRRYTTKTLPNVASDHPGHGFTVLLIPALSDIHASFADEVANFKNVYDRPLVGWISGIALEDIGKVSPKVFEGTTGESSSTDAVAMHIVLPENYQASVDIVNLFDQGTGDTITFNDVGFSVATAMINGKPTNLATYMTENKVDTKLPLVANYNGALVNVSIQSVEAPGGVVKFYAPVFPNIEYKIAAPVADYVEGFNKKLSAEGMPIAFGCNCVLNYFYAELEGRKTGSLTGPMTFGEIAYMLLNQTAVYLTVDKVD